MKTGMPCNLDQRLISILGCNDWHLGPYNSHNVQFGCNDWIHLDILGPTSLKLLSVGFNDGMHPETLAHTIHALYSVGCNKRMHFDTLGPTSHTMSSVRFNDEMHPDTMGPTSLTGTVIRPCYSATHSKPVTRHSAVGTCLSPRWLTSQQHKGSLVQVLVKQTCDSLIGIVRTSVKVALFQSLTSLL